MKIGIIGNLGVVGSTLEFAYIKLGHDVIGYDIKGKNSISDVINFRPAIIYVCVPTPITDDGNCDTSIVEKVINDLLIAIKCNLDFNPIIAIKSTVIPGTTEKIIQQYKYNKICFVPEFLRERCAIVDMIEMHNLLAVGTHSDEVFDSVVKSHGHYPKNVVRLTPTEAEFLKYYHNAVAALRIIFANEMYDLAEALGINYLDVKNALIKSTQLPDKYFDISKNMRGFCGTCLPKDTLALLKLAQDKDVDLDLLEATIVKNQKYTKTAFPGMRQ